jgi:hypothetical protein
MQVLCCSQLTELHLYCRDYAEFGGNTSGDEVEEGLPFIDPADARYHIPSCFQLNIIALHMKQLQALTIMACQQDKLLAILDGPLLPNLKQLCLNFHKKHAHLKTAEGVQELLHAISRARPAVQALAVGFYGGRGH